MSSNVVLGVPRVEIGWDVSVALYVDRTYAVTLLQCCCQVWGIIYGKVVFELDVHMTYRRDGMLRGLGPPHGAGLSDQLAF